VLRARRNAGHQSVIAARYPNSGLKHLK